MSSRLMRFFLRMLMVVTIITVICGIWNIGSAGKIYAKAWLAETLLEEAWQRTLDGEQHVRPWPWADTWPVAELIVPRLGLRRIVLSGDSGRVLAFSPGYSEASALPGAHGKTIISGHRDTHFKFLKEIQNGDRIELKTSKDHLVYIVSEQVVVDQRYFWLDTQPDFQVENQPEDQALNSSLILVTCYPFDSMQPGGNDRYLIVAEQSE
jgi:sortase A